MCQHEVTSVLEIPRNIHANSTIPKHISLKALIPIIPKYCGIMG